MTEPHDAHSALPTGTWRLDPTATSVSVATKKLAVFTVTGKLAVTAGTIRVSEGDGGSTSLEVDVTVDAATYESPVAKRNEHVRSADFLDADSHPTITFTGGALTDGPSGTYQVAGNVAVKGRLTPMVFTVSDVVTTGNTATFTGTADVDRRALGVDKMPSFFIGDTLHLSMSASATRDDPPA